MVKVVWQEHPMMECHCSECEAVFISRAHVDFRTGHISAENPCPVCLNQDRIKTVVIGEEIRKLVRNGVDVRGYPEDKKVKAQRLLNIVIQEATGAGYPPEMTHKSNLFDISVFDFGQVDATVDEYIEQNVAGHIIEGYQSKGSLRGVFAVAMKVLREHNK